MAGWLEKCGTVAKDAKILDIGCGNGALLCALAERGFTNLWGTDYCQEAIELAERVTNSEGVGAKLVVTDILTAQMSQFDDAPFDVCTDKGTYDAISLCPEDSCSKRKQYVTSVASLLTDRGIYIITSCNWTGEEIEQQFEPYFVHRASIPATPTFQFGGKTGQTVSTLVLQKNTDISVHDMTHNQL